MNGPQGGERGGPRGRGRPGGGGESEHGGRGRPGGGGEPEAEPQAPDGPSVRHLFLSPHPDDVALSCGGLVALLRDRGESVAIATFYGGPGSQAELTPYQRRALGFGEWSGPLAPADAMAERLHEDEVYAAAIGARLIRVDLPDAVFRGYEGNEQLMGAPRSDDPPPSAPLESLLDRLSPALVYVPLGVGGHVDHRQVHRAGIGALIARRRGREFLFYEDLPYAVRADFHSLEQLRPDQLAGLSPRISLIPEYVELSAAMLDRKLAGIRAYASQVAPLFGSDAEMEAVIRARATAVGKVGATGPAERYWRATTT